MFEVFVVGGAVRDELLGLPVNDRDFVVVGAHPEDLLFHGFRQVGKDFPVFLHPQTQEEYALARTERKTGPGYHGFACYAAPDVTLEEDLARRDLTINAMARAADGRLVDPYGGRQDIEAKVLRHVGQAFAEDPVRILRLARFAARYTEFSVAPETMLLMKQMVAAGEVDHLVAERVWQEFAKGLLEAKPSRMFQLLREVGALARLLPDLDRLFAVPQPPEHHPEGDAGTHTMMALDLAASCGHSLDVRLAVLLHDLGKGVTSEALWPAHHDHEKVGVPLVEAACNRLKVPATCRELAVLTARYHTLVHQVETLRTARLVKLLSQLDAYRRPERFRGFLAACMCDAKGRLGHADTPYIPFDLLERGYQAAKSVDAGAIAKTVDNKQFIPERIHEARVRAVKAAFR